MRARQPARRSRRTAAPTPTATASSTNAGDNCPTDANPDQANTDGDAQGDACDADDDNDGVGDDADQCEGTSAGTAVAADGCDRPRRRRHLHQRRRQLPTDANPDQANTDGDAQGDACDADDDNDGVGDDADQCEGTTTGTTVAADGCAYPYGDGISTNAGDNCPTHANPDQANTDGDAQGDAVRRPIRQRQRRRRTGQLPVHGQSRSAGSRR